MKSGSEVELIFEYVNIMFMLLFIFYYFVFIKLEKYLIEVIKLWELLGELEVVVVVLNYCIYMFIICCLEFIEGGVIVKDIYYLLLKEVVVNLVNW